MRRTLIAFGFALAAAPLDPALAEAKADAAAPPTVTTDRLILEWTEPADAAEVGAVTAEATKTFERVAALLGERPSEKITIVFGGMAERPGGTREHPRVDSAGRVLVFKFIPDYHNYFTALPHEMVHAFRFERRQGADWFFEEGFAEFVALRADPSMEGFPWFGFPVTVVAGQWRERGEDIPLSRLRERHRDLNLGCRAQSYSLRSAFFDWLGRTFGDDKVYEAAKPRPAGSDADYEKFFGRPLAELETQWRAALLDDYRAIPDAAEQARRFRKESPIQYMKVCRADEFTAGN